MLEYAVQRRFGIHASDFGAKGDGVTDDTKSIQAAVYAAAAAEGIVILPAGNYLVTDAITLSSTNLVLQGAGQHLTTISVPSNFNLSAQGVLVINSGEPGARISGIRISFAQPDTSTLANLVQYPPAIYAVGQPRFQVAHVRIENAWNGIDMTGNSGGALIEDLEIGMFNIGVNIDGSEDIVRINDMHVFNFSMTNNQLQIFRSNAVGIQTGRCDGLFLTNYFSIGYLGLKLYNSANGNTFGQGVNCGFDTYGGVDMSDGSFKFSASYFSLGDAASTAVNYTGGLLLITGSVFEIGVQANGANVICNSSTTPEQLTISGCAFHGHAFDQEFIDVSNGYCHLIGNLFERDANTTYTTAMVHKSSGRVNAVANRANDQGGGSCTFFKIDAADYDYVIGNPAPGRPSTFPASGQGRYEDGSVSEGTAQAPAIPASGVPYTNSYGATYRVFVSGGTVSGVSVNGNSTGLNSGTFTLQTGDTITITYTAAPVWLWLSS